MNKPIPYQEGPLTLQAYHLLEELSSGATVNNICMFLLAVMGVFNASTHEKSVKNEIGPEEGQRIHRKYHQFSTNRLSVRQKCHECRED